MRGRAFLVLASICFAGLLPHANSAQAGSLLNSVDQACGKAVDNLGCTDLATGFPEALGGAVGAISAAKGQFANADDCQKKLAAGSSILAQLTAEINVPGLPFGKLAQCSCGIVYSNQTCTAAVIDYTQKVSDVLKSFFCTIGICDEHQAPVDPQKEKANYYQANYVPHLAELQHADYPTAHDVMIQVSRQCNDDWYGSNLFYDPAIEVCGPLYHQFFDELGARQKTEQDAINAELQKQAEALQKAQDAATDNARKIAMNWAQIKLKQYGAQCADKQCVNDIGVLAFVYYGAIASGMQKLDASNTAALTAANAQFEPLFKQKVAESGKRRMALSGSVRRLQLSPAALKFESALAATKAKLASLGVVQPEKLLAQARLKYVRHTAGRGLKVIRPVLKQ